MIDAEMGNAITWQMYQHWIAPEIERRGRAGTLPADFTIRRCLIRLPTTAPPIVEFNNEITLSAKVKIADGRKVQARDAASLPDIERIEWVYPPEVGGVRVAFVYAHWVSGRFSIFFDFTPNHSTVPQEDTKDWKFGELIGAALQTSLVEQAISVHDSVQADLMKIGLWAAPALLPYPLRKIASLLKEGHEDEARKLFISHFSGKRLSVMVAGWWGVPEFDARRKLIEQCLLGHEKGWYEMVISTLIPHLEGITTDWVHAKDGTVSPHQKPKAQRFRDLVLANPDAVPVYRSVVTSALDFISTGPVMAKFTLWLDALDNSFPNRHAVGHGRFDPGMYSEANSIKLFLMLDTICQIIAMNTPPTATGMA